jgi:hypothetical protein
VVGFSVPLVVEFGVVFVDEPLGLEVDGLVVLVLEPVVSGLVAEVFEPLLPALGEPPPPPPIMSAQAARAPLTAMARIAFEIVTRTMSSLLR